ncbi:hypothetical protein L6452_28784 [Arctium lappa]|uniref:Uncharacterized protein n=1 Tax=Arctium lappa TaxID=4217 RepID=A0ACB9A3R5_ARCLA|nr:hypothetical protein L6452_28784 [Arctium lappa]
MRSSCPLLPSLRSEEYRQLFRLPPEEVGFDSLFFGRMHLTIPTVGFDSLFFGRIDYQDRAKRKDDKHLEVIWRGSKSLGCLKHNLLKSLNYNI